MSRVRRPFLRPLKWAGTTASFAIILVWLFSRWYNAGLQFGIGSRRDAVFVLNGLVAISWHDQVGMESQLPRRPFVNLDRLHQPFWLWWFSFHRAGPPYNSAFLFIPLWAMLIPVAVPTIYLWLRDRRLPGHCPNWNYNLSGLPNSPCPECGHRQS